MDKIRNECLNLYLFRTIYEERVIISKYIDYYNTEKPHSAIGYEIPVAFNENPYTIKFYRCPGNRGMPKLYII